MTGGKNLARAITRLGEPGALVYVVDSSGNLHPMDRDAYASLTAAQLEGCQVFLSPDLAEKYAERRRAGRN